MTVKQTTGFGSIELVVSVVLMSVLSFLTLPKMFQSLPHAKDGEIQKFIQTYARGVDAYTADYLLNGYSAHFFKSFPVLTEKGIPRPNSIKSCTLLAEHFGLLGGNNGFYPFKGGIKAYENVYKGLIEKKLNLEGHKYAVTYHNDTCNYFYLKKGYQDRAIEYNPFAAKPVYLVNTKL